eukprot:7388840-Prymnesium_polylepis.1
MGEAARRWLRAAGGSARAALERPLPAFAARHVMAPAAPTSAAATAAQRLVVAPAARAPPASF